ncbi:PhoD-like phosphatase [Penicillium chermesinum]|uniref:PhoD-like phosphatase n=1 Tax=Penicillium chermesinum TaxID=63820 RepID=A0A9W9PFJ5_9EURO|nr:PhoD-like phosphatase [Penicillium chermesinum]KAJ5245805.1 PhoD-like phosphatase [Penicillium chermesinum]
MMRSPGVERVRVQWKSEKESEWNSDMVEGFNDDSDFVATIVLSGLQENTLYTYTTNASHNHSLRIRGLEYLSKYITHAKIDFMLFLGDFIYIDIPQRYGCGLAHYQTAYRHVYASPSWSKNLQSIPFLHMYDDHEITNDWSAQETGLYQQAIQPFIHYQHQANPPPFRAGATYFTFDHGNVSFFVTDNRRYRSGPEVTDEKMRTMLGSSQLADLKYWLRNETKWKVLVSGVPFTRNWRGASDESDSWAGYLSERQQLLEIMWQSEGVVIISGDRHEHATTLFPSPNNKTNVIEFSTSPLSQFFQPMQRTYKQVENTDVEVYTHAWGSSKFGVLEFNTTDDSSLHVHFDLIVDGRKVWYFDWSLGR